MGLNTLIDHYTTFLKIVFNFSLLILYFPCMKELGRKTFQHLLPLPFLVASLFYLCCLYIFYLYIFHQFFFNLPGSEFPVQPPVSIHILPLVDSLLEYSEQIEPCGQFSGVFGVDSSLQRVQWNTRSRYNLLDSLVECSEQTVYWSARSRQNLVDSLVEYSEQIEPCRQFSGVSEQIEPCRQFTGVLGVDSSLQTV